MASFCRLLTISRISKVELLKRSIMTTSPNAKKFLNGLKDNPYFNKYAGAIAKLQQTNPEEFFSKIEENEKKKKPANTNDIPQAKSFGTGLQAKPCLFSSPQTNTVRLSDVMKMELLENKGKDEIAEIWLNYHKQKDCISGIMDVKIFETMSEVASKYPIFLLPLPRENGYEFILSQFSGNEVHMTPLLWYQTHHENAPECLKIIHYVDLMESKGIVLMKGEFDSKSLNVQEAQCLANELQLYYAKNNKERLHLLEVFTRKPDEFKHMDLIKQLETISLITDTKEIQKLKSEN